MESGLWYRGWLLRAGLPIFLAVIEKDFFPGLDIVNGLKSGAFPACGDDEEGIGLAAVVDESGIICLWSFADNDMIAGHPEDVIGAGMEAGFQLGGGDDCACVVADSILDMDVAFGKQAQARIGNRRWANGKGIMVPSDRLSHRYAQPDGC